MRTHIRNKLQRFSRGTVITLAAVCCLLITAGAVSLLFARGRTAFAVQQPRPVTPAEKKPKDIDPLLPDGMPVTFSTATAADSEKGNGEIRATLSNRGISKINSIGYVIYEFDPTGNLIGVEGGIEPVEMHPGQSSEFSIVPSRVSNPKNRVMLGIEKVSSDKESWQAASLNLAGAGAEKAKGLAQSPLTGKKDKEPVSDDTGATFCINGYRRALDLAAAGDKTPPISFTCDQSSRVYTFTFKSKSLGK